jgi:hypothetical protein
LELEIKVLINNEELEIADAPKSGDTLAYLDPDSGWIRGFYHPFISESPGSAIFANTGESGIQQILGFINRL